MTSQKFAAFELGQALESAINMLGKAYGWSEAETAQLTMTTKTHLAIADQAHEESDNDKQSNGNYGDADRNQSDGGDLSPIASDSPNRDAQARELGLAPNANTGRRNAKLPLSRILAIARNGSQSILGKSDKGRPRKRLVSRRLGEGQVGLRDAERLKRLKNIGADGLRHHNHQDHSLKIVGAALARAKGDLSARRIGRLTTVVPKDCRWTNTPPHIAGLRPFLHTAMKLGRQARPTSGLGTMHQHEKISGFAPYGRLANRSKVAADAGVQNFRTSNTAKFDSTFETAPKENLAQTRQIDQWQFSEMLSRELNHQARLPPSGATGFDPRLSPAWPGIKLPN